AVRFEVDRALELHRPIADLLACLHVDEHVRVRIPPVDERHDAANAQRLLVVELGQRFMVAKREWRPREYERHHEDETKSTKEVHCRPILKAPVSPWLSFHVPVMTRFASGRF